MAITSGFQPEDEGSIPFTRSNLHCGQARRRSWVRIPSPAHIMNKLRVGWFSFTCCEDSTILFTELLNTHWDAWKDKLEFVNARVLKTNRELKDLDISFVEGAISSEEHVKKLQDIRANSKVLVAIGACAVTAMPSGWRNTFDEKTKQEIQYLVDRFSHLPRVEPLSKFVKVDDVVPGCPMDENTFLAVLNKYIQSSHSGLDPESK